MARSLEPQQVPTKMSEQEKIVPLSGKFSFNLYSPALDPTFNPQPSGDAHADMLAYRFHYYNNIKESEQVMKGRDKAKIIIWSFPHEPTVISSPWEQSEPQNRLWTYKDGEQLMTVTAKTYSGQMSTTISYEQPWPLFIRRRSMTYFPVGRPLDAVASEEYSKDSYAAMAMALPVYYLNLAVASAVGNSQQALEKLDLQSSIRSLQQKMLANSENQFRSDNSNACGQAGALGAGLLAESLGGKIDETSLEQAKQNFRTCMQNVAKNGEITIYVSGVAAQETYVIGGKTYEARELNLQGGQKIGEVVSKATGIEKINVVLRMDSKSSDAQKAKDFNDLATELDNISSMKNAYSQTLRQWAEQCKNGQMDEKNFNQKMTEISRRSREDAQMAQARGIFEGILFSFPGASFSEMYRLDGGQTQVKMEKGKTVGEPDTLQIGMRMIAGPKNEQLGMTWNESEVMDRAIGAGANLDLTNKTPTKNLLNITPVGDGTYYIDRIVHLPVEGLKYAAMMPYGFMGGESGTALVFEFEKLEPFTIVEKAELLNTKSKREREQLRQLQVEKKTAPWADYSFRAGVGAAGGRAYYDNSRKASQAQRDEIAGRLDEDIRVQRYKFNQYLQGAFDHSLLSAGGRLERFGPVGFFADVEAGYVRNPTTDYNGANATWYNTGAAFVKGAAEVSCKLLEDVRASAGGGATYASIDKLPKYLQGEGADAYRLIGSFSLKGAPALEISDTIGGHANAALSNVHVEVRADKNWFNIGIRTDWDTANLFGPGADVLAPLNNLNRLKADGSPIQVITTAADLTVNLFNIGAAQVQLNSYGTLDWSSRLPVNAGAGLEYRVGDKRLGNYFTINAGQDLIYHGGAGNERFDAQVFAGLNTRFWDYFNAGIRYTKTTAGAAAWRPASLARVDGLSANIGISIPLFGGQIGGGTGGKKADDMPPNYTDRMPPTYEENIIPITAPATLMPTPIEIPVSKGTLKAIDGSEIKVEVKTIAPKETAAAKAPVVGTKPKGAGTLPAARKTNPVARTEVRENIGPAPNESEPAGRTLAPAPQVKTLPAQQLEFEEEQRKRAEEKARAAASKTAKTTSGIVFSSGGIQQAAQAPVNSFEDSARYEQNKKTENGEKLANHLKTLASSMNESGFGIEYRARFGAGIVDENRMKTLERTILGGDVDVGVSFFRIYSPDYGKDAQGYIDNFLTPLHNYLKEKGIDTQAWVEEIKMGSETIGMQVRLVLPQNSNEIDAALRQRSE